MRSISRVQYDVITSSLVANKIFHLSFDIFHLSFVWYATALLTNILLSGAKPGDFGIEMSNDKWKMTNGKSSVRHCVVVLISLKRH